MTGAAAVIFLSTGLSYLFQVRRMHKLTGLNTLEYSLIFVQGIGISLIVFPIWLLTYNIFSFVPLLNLIYGLIGCLLAYGIGGMFYLKTRRV